MQGEGGRSAEQKTVLRVRAAERVEGARLGGQAGGGDFLPSEPQPMLFFNQAACLRRQIII